MWNVFSPWLYLGGPCYAPEAFVTRLAWQIDGVAVDRAVGEYGWVLVADVEALLVNGL